MKKILFLIVVIFSFFGGSQVEAQEVHLYLFYGDTCPICENLREFLKEYDDDEEVVIHEFEVYQDVDNLNLLTEVKEMYDQERDGVPFLVIGDKAFLGYSDARKTRIQDYISKYKEEDYYDRVGVYLGLYEDEELIDEEEIESITSSAILENTNLSNSSVSWKLVVGVVAILALVILLGYQIFSSYHKAKPVSVKSFGVNSKEN